MGFCLGSFGMRRHSPTAKHICEAGKKINEAVAICLFQNDPYRDLSLSIYTISIVIVSDCPARILGRNIENDTLKIMEMILSENWHSTISE